LKRTTKWIIIVIILLLISLFPQLFRAIDESTSVWNAVLSVLGLLGIYGLTYFFCILGVIVLSLLSFSLWKHITGKTFSEEENKLASNAALNVSFTGFTIVYLVFLFLFSWKFIPAFPFIQLLFGGTP
jgi:heme/copper-type cytochrome/quinol oxidase subunit 2